MNYLNQHTLTKWNFLYMTDESILKVKSSRNVLCVIISLAKHTTLLPFQEIVHWRPQDITQWSNTELILRLRPFHLVQNTKLFDKVFGFRIQWATHLLAISNILQTRTVWGTDVACNLVSGIIEKLYLNFVQYMYLFDA